MTATVQACEIMSRERVGVLLVFERETPLDDYFKTGTIVDAQLSEQLLRNLFLKTLLCTTALSLSEADVWPQPAVSCR